MSELNDSSELQKYSAAVLYVLSAVDSPADYVHVIANHFLTAIKSSDVSGAFLFSLPFTDVSCFTLVMACAFERAAHFARVLLPELNVHLGRRCDKDDGRSVGLSF